MTRLSLHDAAKNLLATLDDGQRTVISLWMADNLTGFPEGAELGGNKTRHVAVKAVRRSDGRKVIVEDTRDPNLFFPLAEER